MKTFRTAGDLGDIIWSLPVVKYHGGGKIFWHSERWTREPMTEQRWALIAPLLEAQPYVHGTGKWDGTATDINLNDFRSTYFKARKRSRSGGDPFPTRRSLAEWISITHRVPWSCWQEPWLKVESQHRQPLVVINRTLRYRNNAFPWAAIRAQCIDRVGFMGSREEHQDFESRFGNVPHLLTPDLLSAATVMAHTALFIGNQSVCYAIAEGMKHPAILEVCPWLPNCLFERPDCIHGWTAEDVGWRRVLELQLPYCKQLSQSPYE